MSEPGSVVWRGVRGSAVAAGVGVGVGVAWWLDHHARSLAVRTWSTPTGESTCAGPLQVRVLGAGSTVVLMLHGMIASGNSFGAGFDPLASRDSLLVPDLLGFGGSLTVSGRVDVDAHVTALDDALAQLRPSARRFVVVGHSMGGVLALHWAARRAEQITAVVTFGAPLYRTAAEADNHVAAMGRMEAFLAGDGAVPRAVCAWMCTHRRAASWVALAARPDLPVAVARAAVKHSWNTSRVLPRPDPQRRLATAAGPVGQVGPGPGTRRARHRRSGPSAGRRPQPRARRPPPHGDRARAPERRPRPAIDPPRLVPRPRRDTAVSEHAPAFQLPTVPP